MPIPHCLDRWQQVDLLGIAMSETEMMMTACCEILEVVDQQKSRDDISTLPFLRQQIH